MIENSKIVDVQKVYVVYVNSDLTEGRGFQYPIAICDNIYTARRLAKKKDVQGSDGSIHDDFIFKIEFVTDKGIRVSRTYAPFSSNVQLQRRTIADIDAEKKEEVIIKKMAAKQRAIELGLTEEDIRALMDV